MDCDLVDLECGHVLCRAHATGATGCKKWVGIERTPLGHNPNKCIADRNAAYIAQLTVVASIAAQRDRVRDRVAEILCEVIVAYLDGATTEERRAIATCRALNLPTRENEYHEHLRVTANVIAQAAAGKYKVSQSGWAGGEHATNVRIGHPAASGSSSRVWSKNGKWSGSNSSHTFTVPLDWLARVANRGMASVFERLCLDAEPIPGPWPQGVTKAERVILVEQGRGFEVTAVPYVYVVAYDHPMIGKTLASAYRAACREIVLSAAQRIRGAA